MRTLLMTAALLAMAGSAAAQRAPYAAPDLVSQPPAVGAPQVAAPGEVMTPTMSVPESGGLPPPAAPRVSTLPGVISPAAPLATTLTPPLAPLAPLPTAPRLDPGSTQAPALTTPEDVVEEVRKLQRDKQLREERRLARERGGGAAAARPAAPPPGAAAAAPRVPPAGQSSGNDPAGGQPAAAPAVPPPGATATTGRDDACSPAGDLTRLLSPACLDTLRALRAPGGALPPGPSGYGAPPPQQTASMTQCAVTMFAASGQATVVPPFPAAGLQPCLAMGARMGFGIPGMTNITAVDPVWGVVAVSCRREAADGGAAVSCEQQP